MSFILDALKKSENDRQRNTGPALFEVKVATPRHRVPVWTIVVAALLLVNLGVVAWLLVREPSTQVAQANAPAAQPAPAVSAPPVQTVTTPPASPPPASQAPAPVQSTPQLAAVETPSAPSAAVEPAIPDEGNPDDYAPAVEPEAAPQSTPFVRRGTESGLPTYEQVATSGRAPQLRMDLHVYGPRPQDRFVLINMQRLREGETMPDGVRVESITTDGAILSYRGERFVLNRE